MYMYTHNISDREGILHFDSDQAAYTYWLSVVDVNSSLYEWAKISGKLIHVILRL